MSRFIKLFLTTSYSTFLSALICVVATLAPGISQAAAANAPADASQLLAARLEGYRTFSASFQQKVVDKSGAVVQHSSGTMLAKRPGYFYWHTNPPMEQFIVADGKRVKVYDPDLMQVTIQDMDQRLSSTPALLLSGNVKNLDKAYRVQRTERANGVVFTLVPKNPDSLFESLALRFEKNTLVEMRLHDSLDQQSTLQFSHVVTNQPIADSKFELQVPPGTDVIQSSN
ncbi:outer membrane lipoprotein chaperone LolA [Mangrovitalea sediminis]|uniref:outer membrane lipoprotein chaperone LolA n=1 Tax=Mangrovitalea sediminis TaxID=1982043 RepID=UPI000BE58A76|nr:outer membrane lipoprotein chaperone LolA [Mangrovitalea sediminis]